LEPWLEPNSLRVNQ